MSRQPNAKNPILSRRELIPALLAVLLLLGVWFWRGGSPPGQVGVVQLDGAEILRLPLSQDAHVSLREEWGVPVEFQVEDGAVRFVNVDCPDHICEREGWLRRDGQTAVCMPNRVVLSVLEES